VAGAKSSLHGAIARSYGYHRYRQSAQAAVLPGAGAVSRVEDSALAAAILYQYDALGRPASRAIQSFVGGNWVDDNHSVSWHFDAVSRRTAMTNVLGEFEYEYDQPAKGLSRLAAVTYPNGQVTSYDWHPAAQHHRLAAITHRKGDNTLISSYGYAFSKGGQLRTWTQQVGADPLEHWQIEHDEAEQLRSVIAREGGPTGTILRQQFYNYDPAGNRTGYQDGHSVRALSYNHLNQIMSQPSGGPVRFEGTIDEPGTVSINEQPASMRTVLDANEDPTFRFLADVPLTTGLNQVTVEAADGSSNTTSELYEVTVTELTGQTAPAYDPRGNMTSNGRGQTYEWDSLNRLLAIVYADDTRTEFTYDALSRRVRILEKDDQGDPVTDKRLLWEGTSIAQERDASNTVVKRYATHGLALSDDSTYFYTRDHLGSIRQITDEDEEVVEHYRYDPYGVSTISAPGGPNGARLADFRYTGHYHHEKSGLHLAMFRAYDVELGVWISEDPIEERGGLNLYGYVGNGPLLRLDVHGLEWYHPHEFANNILDGSYSLAQKAYRKLFDKSFDENYQEACNLFLPYDEDTVIDLISQVNDITGSPGNGAQSLQGFHGNDSRSTRPQTIYQLIDRAGRVLKVGITCNPLRRYMQKFKDEIGAVMRKIGTAPDRRTALDMERNLRNSGQGGPLNRERY